MSDSPAPLPAFQTADLLGVSQTVLSTHGLCLSYGRYRAVEQLGISVRPGEIYGFLGRNGAGKTSTIRMLMGVIRPDAGTIQLLDFQGRRIGTRQKQRIGYVSQEQHFYPWMTCRGLGRFVSGFYPTWDRNEFARLLQWLDLPPDRKVAHLSGGMKVKLALALALAHRPPLLILDEPTSGLDPVARREFLEIIHRQARDQQRTTFFSSHLIDEVERVADRIGIIHKGRLRYEGDIGTLQASVREVRYDVTTSPSGPPPLEPAVMDPRIARTTFASQAAAHGFQVLRDGFLEAKSLILQASPTAWATVPFPAEAVRQLSLEDIFIALASEIASGP